MQTSNRDQADTSGRPFVPARDPASHALMSDRKRFVLWQATGMVIDDTDFTGVDKSRHRLWFPPCTHQMSVHWWATMRAVAESVEECLRSGRGLRTENFAEEVVLAGVLGSECLTQVIDSLDDEPDEYDALYSSGEDDLDFKTVLPDLADDKDAELLFADSFEVNEDIGVVNVHHAAPTVIIEAVCGDPEQWFEPYDRVQP